MIQEQISILCCVPSDICVLPISNFDFGAGLQTNFFTGSTGAT